MLLAEGAELKPKAVRRAVFDAVCRTIGETVHRLGLALARLRAAPRLM